jgi:hypothetical protein
MYLICMSMNKIFKYLAFLKFNMNENLFYLLIVDNVVFFNIIDKKLYLLQSQRIEKLKNLV